ncbi:hypothetical protein [Bradyrhizobium cajani]|uniref:hypothetical protein n=1 Tax=Bradyrhizobium cajani TaxID=1928661 RepID=UPI001FE86C26|nr:hypothetical protein [Bradyrhizobium cajani]MCP3372759.1 hypothetical protein [Bradyrhizobium cajani]
MIGNEACGVLTDRLGSYKVLIGAVTAQLILLVGIVAFGRHGFLTLLIAFLWGNVSYMYLVPIQHRLLGLAGERSRLVLAMNSSTILAGIAIGAFFGGIIVETNGVKSLAGASILIGLVGLGLAVVFVREAEPAEAARRHE